MVDIADNTGAKQAMCIKVLRGSSSKGKFKRKVATIGDVIICAVKKVIPSGEIKNGEIIRCVICLKQGYWPSREQDVEEVDVDKLKEMVHVKDEDIAAIPAGSGASKKHGAA